MNKSTLSAQNKKIVKEECTVLQRGEGALCVEMGFYADISWELRCNIEINV